MKTLILALVIAVFGATDANHQQDLSVATKQVPSVETVSPLSFGENG